MKGCVAMAEFFSNAWELTMGFFKQLLLAFADFRIRDAIDILIVAFVIYKAIGFFKETRAKVLIKGLLLLLGIWFVAQWFDLISIKWLLMKFFDYAIIAVAIIFQPELRHALERVGHSKLGNLGVVQNTADTEAVKKSVDEVCKACATMQEQKIGALIVFERSTPLGEVTETGTTVDAAVSQELVGNIFYPKSPLHDGGMIIRDCRVAAAGCILPLTANNELSKELGTRHRAAVGMSESSDAVVVVVSEETGVISVCINGTITRNFNQINLRERLYKELITVEDEGKKNLFTRIFGKKDRSKTEKSAEEQKTEENTDKNKD